MKVNNTRFKEEFNIEGDINFISDRSNCKGYYLKKLKKINELNSNDIAALKKIGYLIDNDATISSIQSTGLVKIINSASVPNINEKFLRNILYTLFVVMLLFNVMLFRNLNIFQVEFLETEVTVKVYIYGFTVFMFGVIFIHELAHIIVSRIQEVEIFKLGFKLKYYIFPMIYVKILPTGNNTKRANIAFAGNVADQLLTFFYILLIIYLAKDTLLYNVIKFALIMQIFMTIANYNLLMPTDFTNFILSTFKNENFRERALKYCKSLIIRKGQNKEYFATSKEKFFAVAYVLIFTVILVYIYIIIVLNILSNINF